MPSMSCVQIGSCVSDWRAFLRAESGAATLDWLAVAAGGVLATVLVVTMVGDDAIGVVSDMNDREAAHEAAVAAAAERGLLRREAATITEPRRLYYPDSPEIEAAAAVVGVVIDGDATALIASPRDAGGSGAFEPAIAEPKAHGVTPPGAAQPSFDVVVHDTAPVVSTTSTRQESKRDAACLAAIRENPFVSESLAATAGCGAAAGPVLVEPTRQQDAPGFSLETVVVDTAPAFEFDIPEALDGCDPAVADSPFMTESLRAAKGCDVGATLH